MRSARDPLSPVDAAWFRMESREDPADILSLMLLDGVVDEARLRQVITERLLTHRRFRLRVVDEPMGFRGPRWEEEPNFSLDKHMERRTLPAGAGEEGLARLVGELLSERLDFQLSPWRNVLIDGLPGGTALVTQVHHCMGDGFALMQVLLSIADRAVATEAGGVPRTARKADRPRSLRGRLAAAARAGTDAAAALARILLLSNDPRSPLRGRPTGERRVAWSAALPLARVKEAARARGVTINDLLGAGLSGALRRYMEDKGWSPVTVRGIVPVNLRPADVPLDEEHGNWFGLVFPSLPTEVADRDERLARMKGEMDRIKATPEAAVALGILKVLGRVPLLVDRVVQDVFERKASIVVTSVPGPREALSLAGHTMRDLMFWVPHPCGLACGASILSYAGRVRVGVRTDAAVVPDPAAIARAFEVEMDALIAPVAGAPAQAPQPRAAQPAPSTPQPSTPQPSPQQPSPPEAPQSAAPEARPAHP